MKIGRRRECIVEKKRKPHPCVWQGWGCVHDLISMGLNERCPLCMGRTVYFENFVTVTFQHLPHVGETGLPKKISRYLSHVRKTDARINSIVGSIHEAASLACGKKEPSQGCGSFSRYARVPVSTTVALYSRVLCGLRGRIGSGSPSPYRC